MIPLFHTSPRLQLPATAHTGKGAFVNTRLVKCLQEKIAKGLLQADCGMQNRGHHSVLCSECDLRRRFGVKRGLIRG